VAGTRCGRTSGPHRGDKKIPNGPTIKIGIEIFTRADGSSWASIAVPDQGAFDTPVYDIHETGATVGLEFERVAPRSPWSGSRPS
jgi:hypothetical protein